MLYSWTALFSIYGNDLFLSLSDSYLHVCTCTFYQHEVVKKIENVLIQEFSSLCQWFIGNKSILFSKASDLREIKVSFAGHSIKQHEPVDYLGCQLDSKLSGEAMTSWVLKKINAKVKFLYRQSMYLFMFKGICFGQITLSRILLPEPLTCSE